MIAHLVSLGDSPSILLDKPILLIGRDPECDIQIDSRKISRRHCCIAQVNDYLVVRDLDSTNGIRINGMRVVEGKLNANDELMIGGSRYRVSWEAPEAGSRHANAVAATSRLSSPMAGPGSEDDFLLEASDEPVALPEDPDRGLPRPAPPTPLGNRAPAHADPGTPPELPSLKVQDAASADNAGTRKLIPDDLSLAPLSQSEIIDPRQRPS